MRFKKGQRVIPIGKTVEGYDDLDSSNVWSRARFRGQDFLYVVGFEQDYYRCSDTRNGIADYFNEEDLVPYLEGGTTMDLGKMNELKEQIEKKENELEDLKIQLQELVNEAEDKLDDFRMVL